MWLLISTEILLGSVWFIWKLCFQVLYNNWVEQGTYTAVVSGSNSANLVPQDLKVFKLTGVGRNVSALSMEIQV